MSAIVSFADPEQSAVAPGGDKKEKKKKKEKAYIDDNKAVSGLTPSHNITM